jgi:hypothetical protein
MEINGYSDYLIYDDGRVWSKPRKDRRGYQRKGKWRKSVKTLDGYHRVGLCRDGKTKMFAVSRLVAQHYIPNPENKLEVDHIDRNIDNNHISNLRWVTRRENQDNKGMTIRNTSGHKYISYEKAKKLWAFQYQRKGHKVRKKFKTKTEALCVKFAFLILTQARNEYSDVSF